MKTRRTMQWLALGLVVPLLGGATETGGPDAEVGSAAKCTITIKARRDPGALGRDTTQLWISQGALSAGSGSKVRIRTGTWSKLGDDLYRVVKFAPDGKWAEERTTTAHHVYHTSGTGQWSGQVELNMGCRYNRRYEFRIRRGNSGPQVRPQYPSTSTWTRSQTIDLGNLARYF